MKRHAGCKGRKRGQETAIIMAAQTFTGKRFSARRSHVNKLIIPFAVAAAVIGWRDHS